MNHKARLTALVLCVVVSAVAVMRIAHLRSIHRTPPGPGEIICGGDLVPCDAIGLSNVAGRSSNYDPCREAEQAPKHSPRFFEDIELTMLRKLDEAQCAVQGSLGRAMMRR